MPCYSPLNAYRSKTINPATGKRSLVFSISQGFKDMPVSVPCGQCIGCRLERSRQWAIRCMHEATLYKNNCFITLTYSPENVPQHNTLVKKHFQDFMKRLRFKFDHPYNNSFCIQQKNVRYYMCGEYGEKNDRPHYHACLFNFDFPDKTIPKNLRQTSNPLYVSPTLDELWPFGFHSIGDVTFQSAAYTARYITKKITGKSSLYHYDTWDERGEILSERLPEYTNMSKQNGGIGKGWYEKYSSDVYPSDFLIVNEKKIKPPKYYDRLLEKIWPLAAKEIKIKRVELAKKNSANNTAARLNVREFIQNDKLKRLKRSYENYET